MVSAAPGNPLFAPNLSEIRPIVALIVPDVSLLVNRCEACWGWVEGGGLKGRIPGSREARGEADWS